MKTLYAHPKTHYLSQNCEHCPTPSPLSEVSNKTRIRKTPPPQKNPTQSSPTLGEPFVDTSAARLGNCNDMLNSSIDLWVWGDSLYFVLVYEAGMGLVQLTATWKTAFSLVCLLVRNTRIWDAAMWDSIYFGLLHFGEDSIQRRTVE